MHLTDYHAKYFAYELTRRYPSDSVEKFAGAVASAQVDLNPHQVEAGAESNQPSVLFACGELRPPGGIPSAKIH
ncbi:MAG: hypothetical protein AABN34_03610 [Acidobacteriota bacterium]